MTRGEMTRLAAGVREAFKDTLTRFDEPSLLRLRGELQVASRWLADRKDRERADAAERTLQALSRLNAFTVEIRGFSGSRQAAETASLFDLGSIGVLSLETLLTAEKVTPMRLLMSALAEGLMFLASRQYVRGSNVVLESTYRTHVLGLQDELWSAAMEFREREGLEAIRDARAKIDDVFRQLDDPGVPVGAKVAVLEMLYALVVLVRGVKLLEILDSAR
ncbi:MAG: hypothetical protein ACT4OI_07955 [Methanobacteriota archaeon]